MRQVLEQAVATGREKTSEGKVATYIPELGKADGSQLGVCVYTRSGERISVGDTKVRFSIQSIICGHACNNKNTLYGSGDYSG